MYWLTSGTLVGTGPFGCLALQLDPLGVYLVMGFAVDPLAFALAVWCRDPGVSSVAVPVREY
jgi:hypothetical protein